MMRLVMMFGLACLLTCAVFAADEPAQSAQGTKVIIQFEDVDAADALVALSQKAQITILGDATVKGKVSGNFINEVPIEDVLNTICKPNNLEWYSARISIAPNERPNAQRILALIDALKGLGNTSLIVQNPLKKQDTVFIAAAEAGSVDFGPLSDSLKLRPIYVVRAVPQPVGPNAPQASALGQPPAEVSAAASQVWNYFSQMQPQTQMQVMRELGRMVFQNIPREQMDQMREQWRQNNPDRGDRGSWGGRDGQRGEGGPPRPPQ